ncbi:MAG: tetratricopeptide repeat protein, partial [Steroidobacteraceae bacterium]
LVLRGRHAVDRWNMEGYEEATTLFQQALDRDPTFAAAAAELAWTYEEQGEAGFLAQSAAFEQARRAATLALKLDPRSAEAHTVLGRIHLAYDWDWAAAAQEFQQAAILAPGSEDVLGGQAQLSIALGRWDDALRQITAALAHDPLDASNVFYLSVIQGCRGHWPEAETAMRRVLEMRPTYAWAHYYLAVVLLMRGDRHGALVEMERETADIGKRQGLAMAYYALGNTADSDAMLAWMIKEHANDNAWGIAVGYAFRGQSDEAMQWLERAYAQKESSLFYIKAYPALNPLKTDPRYKTFLKKMNLPE